MDIKVLGSSCANCKKLYANVERVLEQTGMDATLTKVEDIPTIMQYGVMSTPALVIDDTVVASGKVPDVAQVSAWLPRRQPASGRPPDMTGDERGRAVAAAGANHPTADNLPVVDLGSAVDAGYRRTRLAWHIAAVAAGLLGWWLVYRDLLPFSRWLTFDLLGLDEASRLGSAVAFFLYDAPKVLMLLVLVVFGVGIIRTFFTPATTRRHLCRSAGIGRQRAGRRPRHRDALLLLLGGAAVHRLRHRRGAPWRHLLLPHLGPHGQRDSAGAPVRSLRMESGTHLRDHRPRDRHRRRVGDRTAQARALGGALGLRDRRR